MPVTDRTKRLVQRRWVAFCKAVVQAQEEHGARVECYFGEGQDVVDFARLEAHHGKADREEAGLTGMGSRFYSEGGAILITLPGVPDFTQDGGGW